MYNIYMHKVYELELNAFIFVGTVLVEIPARKAV